MLPFIPALILLLLQGPSNFERLAMDARLPAALEAIHRQMAEPGGSQLSEREEQALASLIAAGTNVQLTRALISFLWNGPETTSKSDPSSIELAIPVIGNNASPPPQDGFERSQRTRDGPAILGATR
jgi:hypothetical protein